MTMQKIQKSVTAAAVIAAVSMNAEGVQASCCWCRDDAPTVTEDVSDAALTAKQTVKATNAVTVENNRLRGQLKETSAQLEHEEVVAHEMEEKAHELEKKVDELKEQNEKLQEAEAVSTGEEVAAALTELVSTVARAGEEAQQAAVAQETQQAVEIVKVAEQEAPAAVEELRNAAASEEVAVAEEEEAAHKVTEFIRKVAAAKTKAQEDAATKDLQKAQAEKEAKDEEVAALKIKKEKALKMVKKALKMVKMTGITGLAIFGLTYGADALATSQQWNCDRVGPALCHAGPPEGWTDSCPTELQCGLGVKGPVDAAFGAMAQGVGEIDLKGFAAEAQAAAVAAARAKYADCRCEANPANVSAAAAGNCDWLPNSRDNLNNFVESASGKYQYVANAAGKKAQAVRDFDYKGLIADCDDTEGCKFFPETAEALKFKETRAAAGKKAQAVRDFVYKGAAAATAQALKPTKKVGVNDTHCAAN